MTVDLADDCYPGRRARRLLVIGAGGGGAQVLDIVQRLPSIRPVGVLDNDPSTHGKQLLGVPILGPVERLQELWQTGAFDSAVVAIVTDVLYRRQVFEDGLKWGVPFANVIHPTAVISTNVALGQGNVLRPFVQLSACCSVGDNNYLAEFVSLGHHARLGSHCTFAARVATSGWVEIGDGAAFGIGACVDGHRRVPSGAIVGPGEVIVEDVPPR